jgi:hypothetical protein
MDLIEMTDIWLSDCKFYVKIEGVCSDIYISGDGTIQGAELGPILYPKFVSPLFDLVEITIFADENFAILINPRVNELIVKIEMKLEMIVKWLKESGLKVNENKT